MPPPNSLVRVRYVDGVLAPDGRYAAFRLAELVGAGEIVTIDVNPLPSRETRGHQFAFLRAAWENLPETDREQPWAATTETLRKHALIACGYRQVSMVACGTPERADRIAASIDAIARQIEGYALTATDGPVVYCYTAESQKERVMGRARFQASKTAIGEWLADLIGVPYDQLMRAGKRPPA